MNHIRQSGSVLSILICVLCFPAAPSAQAAAPLQITFGQGTSYATGNFPDAIAIADLTGNGKQDLVVANTGDGTVSVLLGNGDGTFQAKQDFLTCSGPKQVVLADMNKDGKPDLVVLCPSIVSVLLGNGDGTFQAHTDYTVQIGNSSTDGVYVAQQLLLGDLNGDGYPDVVTLGSGLQTGYEAGAHVLLNSGAGMNGALQPVILADPTFAGAGALLDVNGDGKLDLAYVINTNPFGPDGPEWALGDGAGHFTNDNAAQLTPLPCPQGMCRQFSTIASGDMNGDGKPDLVLWTSDGLLEGPCAMLGDGKGGFSPCNPDTTLFPANSGAREVGLSLADFNNSGHPSIITWYTQGGNCTSLSVSILVGQGDGTFQTGPDVVNFVSLGGCPQTQNVTPNVAVGDFNGDGLPDVAVIEDTNSVIVYLNTSSTPDAVPVASNGSVTTLENVMVSGTLTATQSQGSPLAYSVVANPSHGTVQIINATTGAFTYTPNSNFIGHDTFTFKVNDGYQYSNTATVSLAVGSVPTASNNSIATTEGVAVSGVLSGGDPGKNPLTFTIITNGSKGTAKITSASTGAFTYTPVSGQTGQDTFTFQVNNGVTTAVATETVFIGPPASGGKGDLDLLSLGGLLLVSIALRCKRTK